MSFRHSAHRDGLGLSVDTMFPASNDASTRYFNHIGTSNLNASSSSSSRSNAPFPHLQFSDIPELHHDLQQYTPPSASPQILSTPPLPWDIGDGVVADDDAEMTDYDYEEQKDSYWGSPRWSQWTDDSFPVYPASQARSSMIYSEDDFVDNASWHSFHKVPPPKLPTYSSPHGNLFAERRSMHSESYPSHFFDTTHNSSSQSAHPSNVLSLLCTPANFSASPSTSITQTPLTLHQPRPSRRIPIISISELAACADGDISYLDAKPKFNSVYSNTFERDPPPLAQPSLPSTYNRGYNVSPFSSSWACKCGCMES